MITRKWMQFKFFLEVLFVDLSKMCVCLIEVIAGSPLADLVSEAAAITVHPVSLALMGHHTYNLYL
jgi:hypothetical protein